MPHLIPLTPLAQLQPQAGELGSWVIIAMALAVGCAAMVSIWKAFNPNPPRISGELERIRQDLKEGDKGVREELEEKTNQLHGRISNLRGELQGDYRELARTVNEGVQAMRETHAATSREIGNMDGKLTAAIQQGHGTQQQLQRHIERHPYCPANAKDKS